MAHVGQKFALGFAGSLSLLGDHLQISGLRCDFVHQIGKRACQDTKFILPANR